MFSGRVGSVVQKIDKKGFLNFLPERAGFPVPGPYLQSIHPAGGVLVAVTFPIYRKFTQFSKRA